MKCVRIVCILMLCASVAACGLKRNLTLPKTSKIDAHTQGQTAVLPGPASTTVAPAGTTPANAPEAAAPGETPPSDSFMISPQVTQPMAPAMLSAPTR